MVIKMKLLEYFTVSIIITTVLSENCDHLGVLIYEDLGCKPEFAGSNSSACPIRYSCDVLKPSYQNKCYFRGKLYNDGESVPNELTYPSCSVGCHCRSNSFTCAILDCPEWLGVPIKPRCYRKYSVDGCCSVGSICPPFDNIEKCVVDGKEYMEGERFTPKNTCLECVCQKGFTGKFEEPFCKREICGVQVKRAVQNIHQSCAPFYRGKSEGDARCCPADFICPKGNEEVKGNAKSEEVCNFGTKTLKVGQKMEKNNVETYYGRKLNKIKCECVVPPLLRCNEI